MTNLFKSKSLILGLFLFVGLIQIAAAQEPAAYIEETDSYNLWNIQDDKEAYIFVNMAYIRSEPSSRSSLQDSLAVGSKVKFIGHGSYNPTFIRGMELPWYFVEYTVNQQKKRGYIWVGLLALDSRIEEKTNNQFLFGFAWKNQDNEDVYYWCEAKVLNKNKELLSSKGFAYYPGEQSYPLSEFHAAEGLSQVNKIYSVIFSGEACGIATLNFNFAWNGTELLPLPQTNSVSDAGVYYYSEELKFPKQHKKGKQFIIKEIEEGESLSDLNDETVTEIKYDVKKSEEVYEWDGKTFKKTSS